MTRLEHLLTIVTEEALEVGQRGTKALRFGLDETQPGQAQNNAERLMYEYADLAAALSMLKDEYPELPALDVGMLEAKRQKIEKYIAYSMSLGR